MGALERSYGKQLVMLLGQKAEAGGEKKPSPGTGECVMSLHGAIPAAGSSWWGKAGGQAALHSQDLVQ